MKHFKIDTIHIYVALQNSYKDFIDELLKKKYVNPELAALYFKNPTKFYISPDSDCYNKYIIKDYFFLDQSIHHRYFSTLYIYVKNTYNIWLNISKLKDKILYLYDQNQEGEDSLFDSIENEDIFDTEMFQNLIQQKQDIHEKLFVGIEDSADKDIDSDVKSHLWDNKDKTEKILSSDYLNYVMIMDLETMGDDQNKKDIFNTGNQIPFIRGFLVIDQTILQACIDGVFKFAQLWELYKFCNKSQFSLKLLNLELARFEWLNELDINLKKQLIKFIKKVHMIKCLDLSPVQTMQAILFPFIYNEQNFRSRTYIYTFNGKNFDHYIMLKEFLEADPSISITNIMDVNRQIYGFTAVRRNKDRENKLKQFMYDYNQAEDKQKIFNSREQRYYREKEQKSFLDMYSKYNTNQDYLNTTLVFRDITTLTGTVSLQHMYNACCDNPDFSKQDFDIVESINQIKNNTIQSSDMENIYRYCFGDLMATAIVVYLLHTEIIKTFNMSPICNFTAGLISMRLFQTNIKFSKLKLYTTTNNFVNHIIYRSIYGGRVYCMKPLFNLDTINNITSSIHTQLDILYNKSSNELDQTLIKTMKQSCTNIQTEVNTYYDTFIKNFNNNTINNKTGQHKSPLLYEVDVNSLYPAAMMNNQYPMGPKSFVNINLTNLQYYLDLDCLFICYVKFDTSHIDNKKLLHLPNHIKDQGIRKNYFNIGTLSGIFTSIDIKECISLGYIPIEVKGGIVWDQQTNVFSEVIQQCYNVRINPESNKALKFIMKICMNSLYGKCAQKPYFKHKYIIPKTTLSTFLSKYKNIDNIKATQFTCSHAEVIVTDVTQCYKYPVELSSFILAYSRKIMNYYINLIQNTTIQSLNQKGIIYYSDTDSLYVDELGLQVLHNLDYIHDTKLGDLKLVTIIQKAIFFGNKIKALIKIDNNKLIEKITFKGFRNIDFNFILTMFLIAIMKQYLPFISNKLFESLDNLITQKVMIWKKSKTSGINIQNLDKQQRVFGPYGSKVDLANNVYIIDPNCII